MPLFEFCKKPPASPSNVELLRMGVAAALADRKLSLQLPPPPADGNLAEMLFAGSLLPIHNDHNAQGGHRGSSFRSGEHGLGDRLHAPKSNVGRPNAPQRGGPYLNSFLARDIAPFSASHHPRDEPPTNAARSPKSYFAQNAPSRGGNDRGIDNTQQPDERVHGTNNMQNFGELHGQQHGTSSTQNVEGLRGQQSGAKNLQSFGALQGEQPGTSCMQNFEGLQRHQPGTNNIQNFEAPQGQHPGMDSMQNFGRLQGQLSEAITLQSFGAPQGQQRGVNSIQSFGAPQGQQRGVNNIQSFEAPQGQHPGMDSMQNFGGLQGQLSEAITLQSFGAPQGQQRGVNSIQNFGAPQTKQFGTNSIESFGAPQGQQPGANNIQSFGAPQGQHHGENNTQSFGAPQGQQRGVTNIQNFGAPQTKQLGTNSIESFGAPQGQQPGANNVQSFGAPQGQQFGENNVRSFKAPQEQQQGGVNVRNFGAPEGQQPGAINTNNFGVSQTQLLGATSTQHPNVPQERQSGFINMQSFGATHDQQSGTNNAQNFGGSQHPSRGPMNDSSAVRHPKTRKPFPIDIIADTNDTQSTVPPIISSSSHDFTDTNTRPHPRCTSAVKKSRKQPLPIEWDNALARQLSGPFWCDTFPVDALHSATPVRVFLSAPRADCVVVRVERPTGDVRTVATTQSQVWEALFRGDSTEQHVEVIAFESGWVPGRTMDVSLMAWTMFPEHGKEFNKLAAVGHFLNIPPGEELVMEYDIQRLAHVYAKLHQPLATNPQLQHMLQHIIQVEQPVARLLWRMKQVGVPFKRSTLDDANDILEREVEGLAERWKDHTQKNINLCSPKQVGEYLFDELKLQSRTRSTDEEALQSMLHLHPCVRILMEHRKVTKMLSSFVKPLLECRGERIHAELCQMTTCTGRLSCRHPNLQQLPRDPLSVEVDIRRSIACSAGRVLLSMDYSQIEIRVFAHFVGAGRLQNTFMDTTVDVYAEIAKHILRKQTITPDERSAAKTVLLALFYGSGNQVVAKQLKVARKQAAEFTRLLLQSYPEVVSWKNTVIARARNEGYCETISRRRRMLPNLKSSHHAVKAEAERQCVNTIVQGSAADLLKKAMLLCDEKLKAFPDARLVLSVHDELIFETPVACVDSVMRAMYDAMIAVGKDARVGYQLSVPLAIHVKRGPSWGEMEVCAL